MKIVNPLYDQAFKYLMDNEKIAKIVLSIILDTKVIFLQSKPQETPIKHINDIKLSRFDFKAIIRNKKGEDKTVLIELQKYKTPNPIMRFRRYLAQNYLREETTIDENGNEKKEALPIISVYILGYDLPEFPTQAVKIENRPYDIINNEYLNVKSEFAELLTHPCIILQSVNKAHVTSKGTRIEKFLHLFSQKLKGDSANYIIDVTNEESDKEFDEIIKYLNKATLDDKLIRQLTYEKEYEAGLKDMKAEIEKLKKREDEAKKREDEAKKREDEAKKREDEAKKRENEAKKRENEAKNKIIELANFLQSMNIPIEQIIEKTGLTKDEIKKL